WRASVRNTECNLPGAVALSGHIDTSAQASVHCALRPAHRRAQRSGAQNTGVKDRDLLGRAAHPAWAVALLGPAAKAGLRDHAAMRKSKRFAPLLGRANFPQVMEAMGGEDDRQRLDILGPPAYTQTRRSLQFTRGRCDGTMP